MGNTNENDVLYKDKKKLEKMFTEWGKSPSQIAAFCGVSTRMARYYLHAYNLFEEDVRRRRIPEWLLGEIYYGAEDPDRIEPPKGVEGDKTLREIVEDGMTLHEAGYLLGMSHMTVKSHLNEYGYTRPEAALLAEEDV